MTGISYTVEIDNAEMDRAFEALIDKFGNLQPFHTSVGEHMLNSVQDNFDSESAPDGTRWQHHAPATVASRLKRNGNAALTILRESGLLAGSFSYEAGSDRVEIGSSMVYAAIHHFGGEAGRNQSVTIPERPILGIGPDDETEIMAIAQDWLEN